MLSIQTVANSVSLDAISAEIDRDIKDLALQDADQLRLGMGTLEVKAKKERSIVHPRTGERAVVPSKNQLVFRPVTQIKDELKKI